MQVDVSLVRDEDFLGSTSGDIVCRLKVIDSELVEHDAVFSIIAEVEVKDSRALNEHRVIFSRDLRLSLNPVDIRIPRDKMRAYVYSGRKIAIKLRTKLVVDDGIIFDTRITQEHELDMGTKPSISTDAGSIIEPSDAFNFFKNLKAIPPEARFMTMILLAVGSVVVAVNTLIGVHDQLSPESVTWLYSHVQSDGDGSSPLMTSLMGSGVLGTGIWLMIRRQLQQYMLFRLRKFPRIERGKSYALSDLIRGQSSVPLEDVTLRVVACNMELGQYKRGSGTSERTVSFREPVRGVILYETKVKQIPAKVPIAPYFDGPVDFDPMFAALYPPFTVSKTHGMEVHWEVQLLHPEFVDQELAGPTNRFRHSDFFAG